LTTVGPIRINMTWEI